VTLPMAASAYFSCLAAVIEAKVSGKDVPRATNVTALIGSGIPSTHPKALATYSTRIVTIAIIASEAKKATFPLHQ
jgi:hypothetical protein